MNKTDKNVYFPNNYFVNKYVKYLLKNRIEKINLQIPKKKEIRVRLYDRVRIIGEICTIVYCFRKHGFEWMK